MKELILVSERAQKHGLVHAAREELEILSPASRPSAELQPGLSALSPWAAPSCEAEAVSSVDQGGVSSLEGFQGRFSERGDEQVRKVGAL